jgi:hypothetical protein
MGSPAGLNPWNSCPGKSLQKLQRQSLVRVGAQNRETSLLLLNYCLVLKSYMHCSRFIVKVEPEYTELSPVNAGVTQGSGLEPLFYLVSTADLPTPLESTESAAVLATDSDPGIASQELGTNVVPLQKK